MALQNETLRPGLLVSLNTSLTGNVSYLKHVLEAEHKTDDGAEIARWETERRIADPAEHKAATVAQSKAGGLIRRVCTKTAFGYLCPEADAAKLEAAIAEARAVADEFNATATVSRLGVYVVTGRIAPDDVEAVKAINSEVRKLLDAMQSGLANLDVKTVRAAASKAKEVGQMLTPDAAARIQVAIDLARKSAREIVRVGENVAQEIDLTTIKRIAEQRTAFLDFSEAAELQSPTVAGRAIDLAAQ